MYLFHSSILFCCFFSSSHCEVKAVQLLKVHEKIFLIKLLHLAQQMPVIFHLVDQITFGPQFYQILQISLYCKCFCLVLSFKGHFTKFFVIQTRTNLCSDMNCQLYNVIITCNNISVDIHEFVHQNPKRIVNVERY